MSNLIKSSAYVSLEEMRLIEIIQQQKQRRPESAKPGSSAEDAEANPEWIGERDRLLAEAKLQAEQILDDAKREAERMKAEAEQEIVAWWNERREDDERFKADLRRQSFDQGYREGAAQAQSEASSQYADMLAEAGRVLQLAHEWKREIIQEAEPFLVELSMAVSGKIIGQHLSGKREDAIRMIKAQLAKLRNKGSIALCVAPTQFEYIHNVKDELALVVDSQAELQIFPDSSVKDHGCVIRTSMGSIDARIETQLTEIKQALMKIAAENREQADDDPPKVLLGEGTA